MSIEGCSHGRDPQSSFLSTLCAKCKDDQLCLMLAEPLKSLRKKGNTQKPEELPEKKKQGDPKSKERKSLQMFTALFSSRESRDLRECYIMSLYLRRWPHAAPANQTRRSTIDLERHELRVLQEDVSKRSMTLSDHHSLFSVNVVFPAVFFGVHLRLFSATRTPNSHNHS